MKEKNKNFFSAISNLAFLNLKWSVDFVQLAVLETKLAFNSLGTMAYLIFFLVPLITGCWISLLVLISLLLSMKFNYLLVSVIIVVINLALTFFVVKIVKNLKRNLSFPVIRRQLSNKEENLSDELGAKNEQSAAEN